MALTTVVAIVGAAGSAEATRTWKQVPPEPVDQSASPVQRARDYAHIMDHRSANELVSVQWLAPPTNPQMPLWPTLLDKYVVVGVTHVTVTPNGSVDLNMGDVPVAVDAKGKLLRRLSEQEMPQDIAKFIKFKTDQVKQGTIPESVLPADPTARQVAQGYRSGFRFYVFENGGTHACTKGLLVLRFSGESYRFDTPLPGCSPNRAASKIIKA